MKTSGPGVQGTGASSPGRWGYGAGSANNGSPAEGGADVGEALREQKKPPREARGGKVTCDSRSLTLPWVGAEWKCTKLLFAAAVAAACPRSAPNPSRQRAVTRCGGDGRSRAQTVVPMRKLVLGGAEHGVDDARKFREQAGMISIVTANQLSAKFTTRRVRLRATNTTDGPGLFPLLFTTWPCAARQCRRRVGVRRASRLRPLSCTPPTRRGVARAALTRTIPPAANASWKRRAHGR